MSYFSRIFVRKANGDTINPAQEDGNLATAVANQTNGTQQTKITDGSDIADVVAAADRTTNLDGLKGLVSAAIAFARVSDTVVKHLRSDSATESLMTIDYAHHEIHSGTAFWYDDVIQLASAATQDYLITVPNTTLWPHFGYVVESTAGGVTVELYEGADKSGTTEQTIRNRDRNSATTATTTVHKGQTGAGTEGTRILWRTSGTGAAAGRVAGNVGEGTERVLKQNTKYIFRVTSKANTNDIGITFNWYEHSNRN